MTRADVDAWADEAEVELILYDGMDDAIVGIGQRFNTFFVVYDQRKAIRALVRGGMRVEDAVEWYEVNVVGGWVGDATPCFVTRAV